MHLVDWSPRDIENLDDVRADVTGVVARWPLIF